jgi:hypothetical protein
LIENPKNAWPYAADVSWWPRRKIEVADRLLALRVIQWPNASQAYLWAAQLPQR